MLYTILSASILINVGALAYLCITRAARRSLEAENAVLDLKFACLNLENLDLIDDLARYKGAWEAIDRMASIDDQMLVDDLIEEINESLGG